MTSKLKTYLTLMLIGVVTASCEQGDLEDTVAESMATVDQAVGDNLIVVETFETAVPWRTAHGTEFGPAHAFSVVTSPVFMGTKAGRFELNDTDSLVSGGTRAEVTIVKDAVEREMWYSFAALFPANEFEKDSEREIINQWWQAGDKHLGESNTSPATALYIENDKFIFDTGYNDSLVSTDVIPQSRRKIDLGPVTKDTWHQFVFHFIHSYQSDGLVEIWHNGTKILTHRGGNMYNNIVLPKWKLGIYKWKWNGDGTTDTKKRVVYYDNIKVGNARVKLKEMMPEAEVDFPSNPDTGGGSVTTLKSLTLVDAHTDTDITDIKNGDTFRLSALGTRKLTIRANNGPLPIVGVKFDLSGGYTHLHVDKSLPYVLFGDDGMGNLFYGNSLPAGTYTLVATPFTYSKGTSKLFGEPYTVWFTVTE